MISTLESALDAETSRLLVDSKIQSKELVQLRLKKIQTNLLKAKQLDPEAEFLNIEDRMLSIEYNIIEQNEELGKHKIINEQDNITNGKPKSAIDELNMLYSDLSPHHQVRHRVNKIEVDNFQQNQLSADIVEMAATIKKNAQLFQQKLEDTNDMVSSTTDAIQKTAGIMSQVGTKLQKYRKETQVGWMFYIFATAFIFLCLFFGMMLTQIFGKW